MEKLTETPRNLRAAWVPMTLAIIAMTLLIAAAVIANPTQAQGPDADGGNTDPYPNLSTYDRPPALRPRRRDRLHGRAARDNHRPLRPLRRLLAHNSYIYY